MFAYHHPIVQQDLREMTQAALPWQQFDHKTVLVTGANSMLGTYTAYLFLYLAREKGMDVKTVVLTRSKEKTEELYRDFLEVPYFQMLHQDVTEPIVCSDAVDYIFHFAGNASPHFINTDPVGILQTNLLGMFSVMELARNAASEKVIFASTREVYGEVDASSLTETSFGKLDPMDNRSCYPESKRAAESILRCYHLQYGVRGISVRIAHAYGPGMKITSDGRVMADFIGCAVRGQNIEMKSKGDALRSFCYLTDAILGLIHVALFGEVGEAYNLSNETETLPIRVVAQQICQIAADKHIKVECAGNQSQAGYCKYPRVALDTSKIAHLGFTPKVTLADGLRRTILSFE